MEAARADLVARVIAPGARRGRVVLCDRYDDSTLAYQGGGRGLDRELLETLNRARHRRARARPHAAVRSRCRAPGLARRAAAAGAANRLDREPADFHRRVRERFLELARAGGRRFVMLDATLDPDAARGARLGGGRTATRRRRTVTP